MIYELRIYSVVPGRIDVSLDRFENHLPALFARHGIDNVGRWIVTAGAGGPSFIYMMVYDNLAQREEQWSAFYGDKDWHAVRGATQGAEEATERFDILFLRPNPAWSPAAAAGAARLAGVHDLLLIDTALGKGGAVNNFLAETYLPVLERSGASIMLAADLIAGVALPKTALIIGWPDGETRQKGWHGLSVDEELKQSFAQQRVEHGRALIGRIDSYSMEPTAFALPLATLGYRTERAP